MKVKVKKITCCFGGVTFYPSKEYEAEQLQDGRYRVQSNIPSVSAIFDSKNVVAGK